jgi:urea transport system ATP-binding protein
MNENPMVPDLALPEEPAEHSLSGVADFGRVVTPGEIARDDPLS